MLIDTSKVSVLAQFIFTTEILTEITMYGVNYLTLNSMRRVAILRMYEI